MFSYYFLGLIVISISSAKHFSSNSKVLELENENFEKITKINTIQNNKTWFIMFYSPYCTHCKRVTPDWEKLAGENNKCAQIGAVDWYFC
jgi:protein disulfide-isomerase A6